MKLLSEILVAAKELIRKPENWTKGVRAQDKDGEACYEGGDTACRFCIIGAIARVSGCEHTVMNAKLFGVRRGCARGIPYFNDHNSHSEVLKFMDKLIEAAKQEELNAQN